VRRFIKIGFVSLAVLACIAIALWNPYRAAVIPSWTVQVLDRSDQPLSHIHVNQQWIDPIEDGMVGADDTQTDERRFATFPSRTLSNRLLLRIFTSRLKPLANIYVCWQEQFGDANWDGSGKAAARIVLHQGSCPYG
jgi:hypothetical protein